MSVRNIVRTHCPARKRRHMDILDDCLRRPPRNWLSGRPIAVCIPAVTGILSTVIHLRVAVGLGPRRTWRPTGTGTPGPTAQNDTRVHELATLTNNASVFGVSADHGYYGTEYEYPPIGSLKSPG
ncbi:hypothetical protein K438DRAFT_2019273 [Mycena galopus ATCC 62051]|nr:hypothetical protein K438DRAFT_2019273 [Mycena galopus ATCC 62051]